MAQVLAPHAWVGGAAPAARPPPRRRRHVARRPALPPAPPPRRGLECGAAAGGSSPSGRPPVDMELYELLGVPFDADGAAVKAAFRAAALREHPDVSDRPEAEATARFAALAEAYEVLSDPGARAAYDAGGRAGAARAAAAAGGSSTRAADAWEEFKGLVKKRDGRRARARAAGGGGGGAAAAAAAAAAAGGAFAGAPLPGAVVEYPLPPHHAAADAGGGAAPGRPARVRGVGLLVGRNADRGDAARLPPAALDLCEVEPLRQAAPGARLWVPDELLPSAYPRLGDLVAVEVAGYSRALDRWEIDPARLGPGCAGPALPEEVVVGGAGDDDFVLL